MQCYDEGYEEKRLLKPTEAATEVENATPQTQRPKTYIDKERLQVQLPNDGQETIATGTT